MSKLLTATENQCESTQAEKGCGGWFWDGCGELDLTDGHAVVNSMHGGNFDPDVLGGNTTQRNRAVQSSRGRAEVAG